MKLVRRPAVRWYVSRALSLPAQRFASVAVACSVAVVAAGCGGGGARQDANEPSGNFRVQIVRADFPSKQSLAKRSKMVIAVKNVDSRTIPNIAVTVKSFDQRSNDPNLADPRRPIFVVNTGPHGGDTAYVGTWALGALPPGQTKVFTWDVTAVVAKRYSLRYAVSAGLNGKARAVLASGGTPTGVFTGAISGRAPQAYVDDNGNVVTPGQ
jgi:hypothetical protein